MRVFVLTKQFIGTIKTVINMPIEVRFNCKESPLDYLTVDSSKEEKVVNVSGVFEGHVVSYSFDITTAIKLSKTIRTEINKVKGI